MPIRQKIHAGTPDAAVLQTILYSSLFDFPLKKDEIWYFLKYNTQIPQLAFESSLENLVRKKVLYQENGYYALQQKKRSILVRQEREKKSLRKYRRAVKIARILSILPTILFVGVSGSLALGNTKESDDIDLFIITEKGALWPTRLFSLCLLTLLRVRRKRGMNKAEDIVCLNMLLDESALLLTSTRQNIYTAHEIAQLKPLLNRKNIFKRFFHTNKWAVTYMPNMQRKYVPLLDYPPTIISAFLHILLTHPLSVFLTRYVQTRYMQQARTTEEISDTLLAFHPHDYMNSVLDGYGKIKKKYLQM